MQNSDIYCDSKLVILLLLLAGLWQCVTSLNFIPNIDFSWSNSGFLWLFKDEIEAKDPGQLAGSGGVLVVLRKNISLGSFSFSFPSETRSEFWP